MCGFKTLPNKQELISHNASYAAVREISASSPCLTNREGEGQPG